MNSFPKWPLHAVVGALIGVVPGAICYFVIYWSIIVFAIRDAHGASAGIPPVLLMGGVAGLVGGASGGFIGGRLRATSGALLGGLLGAVLAVTFSCVFLIIASVATGT